MDLLYRTFIEPRSVGVDNRRREFILNVLLTGMTAISSVALLVGLAHLVTHHSHHHYNSLWSLLIFGLIVLTLLIISRRGKPNVSAFIFVGFLLLAGLQFSLTWGFGLADAELLFALTIVVAGVLFTAPLSLVATIVVAAALLGVTILQVGKLQVPQTYWQHENYDVGDAIGFIAIFVLMGIVSWLSNREIDRSLKRARASELELQKERDSLEVKVLNRTKELEELQLSRLLELQPFAEFGRIGAGLVHEIANPLTAASLNLEELNRQQQSDLTRQVQRNLHHLERYLLAARKQIKRESRLQSFAVGAELRQITNLLRHRARNAGVVLAVDKVANVKLYGDVVKFNQLVANLLANAIDAAEPLTDPAQKVVSLQSHYSKKRLELVITDHGAGIPATLLPKLFEPFYSTKTATVRSGLGIGLALVKQYVEYDFQGTISVVSTPEAGTVFTLQLMGQNRP